MALSQETAERWLDVTIQKLQENIRKHKIGVTGALERDLAGFVKTQAGGDVQLIELFYNWYGGMVELGVGKGVPLTGAREERQIAKLVGSKARKPKPWLTKELSYQRLRLQEIMQNIAAEKSGEIFDVPDSMSQGIRIQF